MLRAVLGLASLPVVLPSFVVPRVGPWGFFALLPCARHSARRRGRPARAWLRALWWCQPYPAPDRPKQGPGSVRGSLNKRPRPCSVPRVGLSCVAPSALPPGGWGWGSLPSLSPAPGGRFRRSGGGGWRLPLVAGLLVGVCRGGSCAFVGGFSWPAGGSVGRALVAPAGRFGVVVWRLPLALAPLGALVFGRGGGGRFFVLWPRRAVCGGLVRLGRVSGGGGAARGWGGSGLGGLGAGRAAAGGGRAAGAGAPPLGLGAWRLGWPLFPCSPPACRSAVCRSRPGPAPGRCCWCAVPRAWRLVPPRAAPRCSAWRSPAPWRCRGHAGWWRCAGWPARPRRVRCRCGLLRRCSRVPRRRRHPGACRSARPCRPCRRRRSSRARCFSGSVFSVARLCAGFFV